MTTHTSMADQLRDTFGTPARRKPTPQIVATLNEGVRVEADSWVEFRPIDPTKKPRFRNKIDLFNQLRDALRLLSGDSTWAIRYASQIQRENHPFLHSGKNRIIMFDPFMSFRDPLQEFLSTRFFLWQVFPSNAYYFKLQKEVKDCQAQIDALEALKNAVEQDQSNDQEQ